MVDPTGGGCCTCSIRGGAAGASAHLAWGRFWSEATEADSGTGEEGRAGLPAALPAEGLGSQAGLDQPLQGRQCSWTHP